LRDHREALTRVQLTEWLPSTTDAAGAFERRDLPANLGRLRFAKDGYRAVEVPLGAHDELALSLTLALDEVEYVVTGHVLAPNGAPVPGARVGVGERVVTTAPDGSYEHRIPGESAPTPIIDIPIVVERSCEFQLELTGERASATSLQVLDGAGTPLQVWQMGGGEFSSSISRSIDGGRTQVLTVAESAATLVLMRRGLDELTRMPIVLRPAEVNRIRW
jgi:hypothetical protein